ncbi:hypothetical protein ABE237_00725 [Brevibacillus formosus]|uniref:hypothetical protein n=1 Tax=Brevibacillus formosus TaxID=54913 RepID=UPI0018CCEB24|nr:hypothetical protein [Brevibacillus formosus]MBG9944672.1 hypothetical protein [Brevibacillus formosus]
MSELQVKIVQEFRKYSALQGVSVDHLTDDQVLGVAERFIGRVISAYKSTIASAFKIVEAFTKFSTLLQAERKRERRLYYSKKKSQSKRKA